MLYGRPSSEAESPRGADSYGMEEEMGFWLAIEVSAPTHKRTLRIMAGFQDSIHPRKRPIFSIHEH